ncbi:oxamate carbamoyltransferase subunit AllH family protein [Solirubrobacter soli]|uniref:oxamate carbamoyltransferase subunit AllH family protein n=1 Tax=Solirubrobacter soli TaxID=363832 RepID=UPI00146E5123|nr:DUF2877 domain-containing protein [Solirubrobacter soli]
MRSAAAPSLTRPLWAGPGAARVLARASRVGVVEIALHPGGYVRFGEDDWVLVAVPSAPRGPLTVLVAGLDSAPLRPGDELHVARVSSFSSCGRERRHSRAAGWRDALSAALAEVPPAPPALAPGLDALRRGDLAAGVHALAGRGEGLTPAGDDVLAGYAAWRHAAGRPVALASAAPTVAAPTPAPRLAAPTVAAPTPAPRLAAPTVAAPTPAPRLAAPTVAAPTPAPRLAAVARERCSPLGLAYLRCAQLGELAEPADAVLRAVWARDVAGARQTARGLAGWGSSSGAAILWGMAVAA